ncbi:similar to Saccharomyces cerevisiae YIL147C SLN1 Histidine kinase osmosensor that regulates a MAP kinase cascade [Maudiozyma saulgeensis]|uniref:histidine kinase n=1 Tax=Maudiozyma saulgeensis TaxID=1789683 RepID=A0A1X7QXI9_9SACH|nr:similar to Saccharomyces cerevisiae YIL147C SLN1 Histidine kinase osmosensor that regulates a MAP kinase cascade [Kazachstania saulgeensis]
MLHFLTKLIPRRFSPKPPYKVSIRTQLTALVSLVAILSLVILAVTTGVYFTSNYKDLRSNRLYIAAQLKSSQLNQTLNYLFYQCYYLSSRDTLQKSLANYVAGNKSESNWIDSQSIVEKFLSSSNLFFASRVYDSTFTTVMNATNNSTGDQIPDTILSQLFPLSTNMSLPSSLDSEGILTDPVKNGSSYLMSMSLPIFTNPSIILSDVSKVYGYITIVMSAEGAYSVFHDTTALEKSNVAVLSAVRNNTGYLIGYHFVFPPEGTSSDIISTVYPLSNGSFLNSAVRLGRAGSVKSTKFIYSKNVAVGYSPCTFALVNWVAVVSQAESVFLSQSTKLAKIIAGTVVAIGVFVIVVTFPLAHWAVKPIVRLQKATELITEGRGLRTNTPGSRSASRNNSIRRTSFQSSRFHFTNSIMGNLKFDRNEPNYSNSINEKVHLTPSSLSASIHADSLHQIDGSNSRPMSPLDEASSNKEVHSVTTDSNERLSNKSRNLTTSTNLIEARVPLSRTLFSDELSDLTETFNTMTDALDQHYALLEDRVRARTKQLEAAKIEAETANEAKTVFIANISHELRTPLNGILGMAAISMEEEDMDKIKNSLKLIFRSGELLLHILTELLTFSKNVLRRTKLEKRNFCITDVALQIKSIFGKIAKDQHVRLSIILSPNIMRTMILYGDSNRIIQIVMNLVSNALKFTPEDGKVDVRIKLLGEYDAVLSDKFQHKKVYVKNGTEFPDDESTSRIGDTKISNNGKIEDITTLEGSDLDKVHADRIDDEHSSTESDREGDETDSKSLVSLSTSSYDDTVFNSQFKKTPNLYEESDTDKGTELKEPKTWVISIEVEDTGSGIDKSLHDSVFEPFVQGDQTLSRQYGGTGLGLSICRQLATMMNGTMELESNVGVGSKFTFTVPLTQTRELQFDDVDTAFEDEFNARSKKNRKVKFRVARSINSRKSRSSIVTAGSSSRISRLSTEDVQETPLEDAPDGKETNIEQQREARLSKESHHTKSSLNLDRPFLQSTGTATSSRSIPSLLNSGKSLRILVAEDNHVNQEVIKRMLNLEGINSIDLACDGQEAFDKIKELNSNNESYDMVFMDVQMPKIDGLLSTRMIRQELNYTSPIVALTAFADDSNIKECIEAGMDGFLSKPIKRPQLKTLIKEYCPDWEPPVKKTEPKSLKERPPTRATKEVPTASKEELKPTSSKDVQQ